MSDLWQGKDEKTQGIEIKLFDLLETVAIRTTAMRQNSLLSSLSSLLSYLGLGGRGLLA
jgi:hypothetical protein